MAVDKQASVLVTGATGFIALHVVDKLLARGYKVIGTARSEGKYTPLLEQFKAKYPNGELSFEIVADIAEDDAFDHVLEKHPEIKYVLHTASPFSYGLNKPLEEAYLNPAVNGTVNILKAITKYAPQVTHVVITSSFAAVKQPSDVITKVLHTNESWNPITWESVNNEIDAYVASKTCAEQAARKFIKENNSKFSFATVNPPFVLGPQVFDSGVTKVLNTSNEIINKTTKVDPSLTTPLNQFPGIAVDVRDVAEFHILPLEVDALANNREMIVSSPLIAQLVLNILNEKYPELKGKIAVGKPDSVDELIKDYTPKYDLTNTTKLLPNGYDFIPLEKTLTDLYDQYFKFFSF